MHSCSRTFPSGSEQILCDLKAFIYTGCPGSAMQLTLELLTPTQAAEPLMELLTQTQAVEPLMELLTHRRLRNGAVPDLFSCTF